MTAPGEYRLSDNAYASLLGRLYKQNFAGMSPDLREEILRFYRDPAAPYATRKDRKAWARVEEELQRLREIQPESRAAEAP